jgi:hypothetical protein
MRKAWAQLLLARPCHSTLIDALKGTPASTLEGTLMYVGHSIADTDMRQKDKMNAMDSIVAHDELKRRRGTRKGGWRPKVLR